MNDSLKTLVENIVRESSYNNPQWVVPVLISLISILLGGFLTWYMYHKTYKGEYYKKIIDKRIKAYEILEHAIKPLSIITQSEGKELYQIFANVLSYGRFYKGITECSEIGLWLDMETQKELHAFNLFLYSNFKSTKNAEKDLVDLIELGKKHFNEISQYNVKIARLIQKDYMELYKVNKFLKQRKHEFKKLNLQN